MTHWLTHLVQESEFWVLVSFVIFLGILWFLGIPAKLLALLDARTENILKALTHAKEMREEAQKLLAQEQRKCQQLEGELQKIVEQAHKQSAFYEKHMQERLEEGVKRLERMAQDRMELVAERAIERVLREIMGAALIMTRHTLESSEASVLPSETEVLLRLEKKSAQEVRSKK